MKLTLDDVQTRLVSAGLMRSFIRPADGKVGYASDQVMVGGSDHDASGAPVAFILYPIRVKGLHKALLKQRVETLRQLFADADNVVLEKPIGQAVAA